MQSYFEKNKTLLASRGFLNTELSSQLSPDIEIKPTRQEEVTIKLGNLLIHSTYDPVREAKQFADRLPKGKSICLYGYGLGYHLPFLLEQMGSDRILLVIELNPDLLSAAMILRDQQEVLQHKNFRLITGHNEKQIANEIRQNLSRLNEDSVADFEVVFHSPSFQVLPSRFPSIANALEILLMERRFPAVLGNIENSNLVKNRDIIHSSDGINSLKDKYTGHPAILISAGPSLDGLHPYLNWLAQRTLLTCVDTTFPLLERKNITPDFVFTLDPQEGSFRYFAAHLQSPAPLIFTPTAQTRILHHYEGKKIVVFKDGHRLYQGEKDLAEEKGSTQSGGSVSCLGLDCLIQMGCDPIILIGQDCAFPNNRFYFRNSELEKELIEKLSSNVTLAQSHQQKTKETKSIQILCNDGLEKWTNQTMYSYLRGIEQIAEVNSNRTIYNLCSHGAHIDHLKSLESVTELIRLLQSSEPITQSIMKLPDSILRWFPILLVISIFVIFYER